MTNASLVGLVAACVFFGAAILPYVAMALRPKRRSTPKPGKAATPSAPLHHGDWPEPPR